jgi:pimeloyl-ACP methyl ester carboxylesterase
VVDDCGRVFKRSGSDQVLSTDRPDCFYDGLVVLDGSIIPSPVGINPALTISAIALRASEQLGQQWFPAPRSPAAASIKSGDTDISRYGLAPDDEAVLQRPLHRVMEPDRPAYRTRTRVQLTERLLGDAIIFVNDREVPVKMELSILSDGVDISELGSGEGGQISVVATKPTQDEPRLPLSSRVRIYEKSQWDKYFDSSVSLRNREIERDEQAGDPQRVSAVQWTSERIALNRNQEAFLSEHASFEATLSGAIELPVEIDRAYLPRMVRGFWAWGVNRGLSDGVVGALKGAAKNFQAWTVRVFRLESGQVDASRSGKSPTSWLKNAFGAYPMLFAHVGRERRLSYSLVIGEIIKARGSGTLDLTGLFESGDVITGHKKLHYVPARSLLAALVPAKKTRYAMQAKCTELANPWAQLMYIHIDSIPRKLRIKRNSVLKLDTGYFARSRLPLFRFVDQDNAIDAYADLGRFAFDLLRPSAIQHFFSFRAPAIHRPEYVRRLEGRNEWVSEHGGTWDSTLFKLDRDEYEVAGLSARTMTLQVVEKAYAAEHDIPLYAALTSYKAIASDPIKNRAPVLMIHGFSASGTTFAHDALKPGLARYLCEKGFDVWVLDMRSSCRAPSARHPWKFEDMANYDIAVAIDRVKQETGHSKVDVVAHCMGAAMFSMAMLNGDNKKTRELAGGRDITGEVHESVGRVVLSQVGPYFNFSPVNRLRAYLLSYFLKFMPVENYVFNPPKEGGVLGLDNALSTLPYQHYEPFHLESPLLRRSAFSRLRRRMDALYGQTFTLSNMSKHVLDRIDEFFGPLNVLTIEQTIWFAHRGRVTDSDGEGYIQTKRSLQERWNKPTLWVHGADNGLSDPASPLMTGSVFEQAGIGHQFDAKVYQGYGHQDTIMGADNAAVFADIYAHLTRDDTSAGEQAQA